MSRTVKIGQLADAVMETLNEYKNLAATEVKKSVKKAGKTVKEEINSSAPVRTGRYSKSWTTKVTAESSSGIEVTVYSPSRYMLAHLLESGHDTAVRMASGGGARGCHRGHEALPG